MDRTTHELTKRIQQLEGALRLMYEAYAVETWQRAEAGLGEEEIDHMKGRACGAVAELLPDMVRRFAEPEPEWYNADDDRQERLAAWFGI